MHDATKVLLGSTQSSAKEISVHAVDPASFPAGLAVSMASTGLPSLLKSAGMRMGVSMGRSLSDHKKTAVLRIGERVPMRASLKRSTGVITISSYANLVSGTDDAITVGGTAFTAQTGAVTPGDGTFRAATDNDTTAASLAAQINAHATASTKVYAVAAAAVVTLYSIVEGLGSGHDVTLTYTDNDTNVGAVLSGLSSGKLTGGSDTVSDIAYIAIGAKAYINDVSGKVDANISGFTTVSDATYLSLELDGIDEDGNTVAAALVDLTGGL